MDFLIRWFCLSLYLSALIFSILCGGLSAQAATEVPSPASVFLARIEHGQQSEDACALVNRSGQYRFERRFPRKTDVFVGTLSQEQLRSFEEMLNQQSLVGLSSKNIPNELITDSLDLFMLDVFRNEGLQHLSFIDSGSRKPFQDSLRPIISWFEQLRKLPHMQIAEANSSRCMPAIPDLQNSGSQLKLVAPADMAYLLTWSRRSFHAGLTEQSCIIVYTDGRYRMEKSNQHYPGSPTTRAFEAKLSSAQVVDLQSILRSPELANLHHDFDQTRPASEIEITSLVIPRATTIQRLSFGSYFNVLGNSRQVGGITNLQYRVDQDRNLIRPLDQWLEKTIQNNNSALTDAKATNCAPSR
jgi:hypothetical protein